jgi:hypothetical protein
LKIFKGFFGENFCFWIKRFERNVYGELIREYLKLEKFGELKKPIDTPLTDKMIMNGRGYLEF